MARPKREEEKEEIPDWTSNSTLRRSDFRSLVLQHRSEAAKAAVHEKEKKRLAEELKIMMIGAKAMKVIVDDLPVQRILGHSARKIDGGKLLDLGVKTTIIEQAMVGGKEYWYVTTGKEEKSE